MYLLNMFFLSSKLPNTEFLGETTLGPAAWTSPKNLIFLRLNHVPWSSYQGGFMGLGHGSCSHGNPENTMGHMDHGHGKHAGPLCRLDPKCIKMCQAELVLFPNSLSTSPFVIGVQLHLMMRQSQWLAIPWLPLWGKTRNQNSWFPATTYRAPTDR